MPELVLTASRAITQAAMDRVYPNRWRLLIVLGVFILLAASNATRTVTVQALSDAFLTVSVFVAGTLALVFWLEKAFSFDLGTAMAERKHGQVLIASLLGALPGCGGAIVVVTQFTRGYVSFGSFIAVLVSTMGDAAFLLLAREPLTALYVFAISLVAGVVTGLLVDWFHGRDFMAIEMDGKPAEDITRSSHVHSSKLNPIQTFWMGMAMVGIIFGLADAFQVDANVWFGSFSHLEPVLWFGFVGATLSLLIWATVEGGHSTLGSDALPGDPIIQRVVADTTFVTSWVIMAFMLYEMAVTFAGLDVASMFGSWVILMPAVAIMIGFIPGCGPQIVVTAIYLSGAIPFSALIANAITNDGDALFPALALAPKAAILATLYSAIPAVLIGYGFYFAGH
ncbi:MAG: putative manganese transporter [Rhizobiaceae bacterium]